MSSVMGSSSRFAAYHSPPEAHRDGDAAKERPPTRFVGGPSGIREEAQKATIGRDGPTEVVPSIRGGNEIHADWCACNSCRVQGRAEMAAIRTDNVDAIEHGLCRALFDILA